MTEEFSTQTVAAGHTLPVDMTRDEFVTFYTTMSRLSSTLTRRMQGMLLAVMVVLNGYPLVQALLMGERVAPSQWAYLGILVLFGVGWYLWWPWRAKSAAVREYAAQRAAGRSFYGQVTVYDDRIVKQSDLGTTTLSIQQGLVCVERPEMLIFSAPALPSVVVGAAYATPEDAAALRRLMARLSPRHRMTISPFVPQAQHHANAEAVEEWPQDEVYQRFSVKLTQEEMTRITAQQAVQQFVRRLPWLIGVMASLAVVLGFVTDWLTAVFSGLAALLIAFAVLVVWPYARSKHAQPPDVAADAAEVGQRGLAVQSGSWRHAERYRWEQIDHIIDRPWCVEFVIGERFFILPKRCIEEWEAFRDFVDAHWPSTPDRSA